MDHANTHYAEEDDLQHKLAFSSAMEIFLFNLHKATEKDLFLILIQGYFFVTPLARSFIVLNVQFSAHYFFSCHFTFQKLSQHYCLGLFHFN